MRRIVQNKPPKSGKFFEGFDARRPGAKESGAKSLVHLSHSVRSRQLECHQLVHCKQAMSKSSENLPERRPSPGEVDLPASTEPPRCCKKGRRGTSVFPGDTFLGGAALGEHFSGVFRGHEKGRPVGRPWGAVWTYTNTSCTSSIYTAVPARMDSSVLRRHRWSPAVTATAMASGRP